MIIPTGGVLALDIATTVGWAYGTREMGAPVWGVWRLPPMFEPGRCGAAFENELADMLSQRRPSKLAIEAPLPASQQTDAARAEMLIGLAWQAASLAYRWDVQFFKRSSQTVRAEVCGRCHRTEAEKQARLEIKDCIVRPWIDEQRWNVTDHNARDACVVWAYEIGMRHPSRVKVKRAA